RDLPLLRHPRSRRSRGGRVDREPYPNAPTAANWTSVGICAHESALAGGERVNVPDYTEEL
ncbi:MAG: hypothetical protein ACOCZB_03830, partial [Spirochaetota bacterium]